MTMGSDSRNGVVPRVLVVHTTEGMMRAQDLRDWTAWTGSSHASADQDGVLMTPADGFVPYDRAAWTLRSGNPWSENIELCGWASYTRADWLARPKILEACAQWLADRSKARGIPLVKLTPTQYRAGGSGVIGHVDHTIGYADGTHTDPGPDFPYDVVLPRAQAIASGTQEAPDMTDDQAKALTEILGNSRSTNAVVNDLNVVVRDPSAGMAVQLAKLSGVVAGLAVAVGQLQGGKGLDQGSLNAAAQAGAQQALTDLGNKLTS